MHQGRGQGAYQSDTALPCGGINGIAKDVDILSLTGISGRIRENAPGAGLS